MKKPPDPVLQAFSRLEREMVAVRAAIELRALLDAGEQPICIKQAHFEYNIPQRSLRRLAAKGCGIRIGRNWFIFRSRMLVPVADRVGR